MKIEVKYINTTAVCEATEPMSQCEAEDCSWFNHSQVGLQGGDYPPNYEGEL